MRTAPPPPRAAGSASERARVVPRARPALLVALLALGACGGAAQRNLLLVTVDTLRADHLGCYGHRVATSPRIDALAAGGTRFADCTAQWPKTWPSMASLMTGAYPRSTGVRCDPRPIPQEFPVLAELLGDAGWDTAAVVANFNVGRIGRFDRGFGHFVESWAESWRAAQGDAQYANRPGRVKAHTSATVVTDHALEWLRGRSGGRPFFLWLHYMDPHGPYFPPARYQRMFQGKHPSVRIAPGSIPSYQRQHRADTGELIDDRAFYTAMYDGSIRYLDDELGRLLDALEELGQAGDTLCALTADHGESLGEHDYWFDHGRDAYQPCARIPLVLAGPGAPRGRVVERPVGLIDLPPTLLELVGAPGGARFEGVSLVPLFAGDPAAPRDVFVEAGYAPLATQLVIRRGDWKLIHARDEAERWAGAEVELYDLAADPGERANLAAERPELVAELRGALEAWHGAVQAPAAGDLDVEAFSEDEKAMLRGLGYLGD